MLCITRRSGEGVSLSLASGEEIFLRLYSSDTSERVRLAIDAPSDVRIRRDEILPREHKYFRERGSKQ